jgi:hypothetical protein
MNEILVSGKYFLGDPSLVLPNKIYIGIFGNIYNYINGKYNILGKDFCVHTTHYGDGEYYDTRNRKYNIESGMIGLIPIELIEDINLCKNKGHIFNFTKKVYFLYDGGLFIIKSDKKYIKINTQNQEEYDESDEDENIKNDNGESMRNTFCNMSDDDFIDNEEIFESDDDDKEDEEKIEEYNLEKSKFQFFKKR